MFFYLFDSYITFLSFWKGTCTSTTHKQYTLSIITLQLDFHSLCLDSTGIPRPKYFPFFPERAIQQLDPVGSYRKIIEFDGNLREVVGILGILCSENRRSTAALSIRLPAPKTAVNWWFLLVNCGKPIISSGFSSFSGLPLKVIWYSRHGIGFQSEVVGYQNWTPWIWTTTDEFPSGLIEWDWPRLLSQVLYSVLFVSVHFHFDYHTDHWVFLSSTWVIILFHPVFNFNFYFSNWASSIKYYTPLPVPLVIYTQVPLRLFGQSVLFFFVSRLLSFLYFFFRFHFDFRYNFSRWICSFNYCILNDVYPFSFIFHLYSWKRVYSFIEFIATVFPCSVFRKQFHFDYNYWRQVFPLNYCVHFVFSLLVLRLHLDSSQLVFSFVNFNLTVFHSFLFRFRFHFDYDFPRLVYPFNYLSRRFLYHFIFRLHFDSLNWVCAFIDLNTTVFPSFLLDISSNCSGTARGQACFYNNKKQMTNAMQ